MYTHKAVLTNYNNKEWLHSTSELMKTELARYCVTMYYCCFMLVASFMDKTAEYSLGLWWQCKTLGAMDSYFWGDLKITWICIYVEGKSKGERVREREWWITALRSFSQHPLHLITNLVCNSFTLQTQAKWNVMEKCHGVLFRQSICEHDVVFIRHFYCLATFSV